MRGTGEPADVLLLEDIDEPVAGPGELLVDVETAGLSFADLLLIRGEYQMQLPLPCVPGSELVGRVRVAGPGTSTPEGTRIIGLGRPPDGAYAEQAVVIENQSEPIPEAIAAPPAVALIGNYVTAHLALHRRAQLRAGEVVVVHGGAGGVGSAAIQVAKAAGATVIAADLGADRAALCGRVGADLTVDTEAMSLTDAVLEHTAGRGADVVVDPVGGELFEQARRCIAFEGRLVVVGFTSGTIPHLRMNQLILRSFTVMGVNALIVLEQYPEIHGEARRAVVELLAAQVIEPMVGMNAPFDGLLDACAELAAGRVQGKASITVNDA
ncbi:MAG: zinc-binding dehydrogenase [Ilumatobacteraceae bacterium]